MQVLSQDETPLLYSLVFGEGVVNDATSVVLFRAVQSYNFDDFTALQALQVVGSFLYLFFTSTVLGVMVSISNKILLVCQYLLSSTRGKALNYEGTEINWLVHKHCLQT